MALRLPSLRNVFKKPTTAKPVGLSGSKVGSLANTQINRTGVTKTFTTKGAARRAAKQQSFQQGRKNFKAVGIGERLGNLRNRLAPPKPPQPKGLSKRAFGSSNAPKVRESFGSYNKRTATPKPLQPSGKQTFGQLINKRSPKFGSMSKAPRVGESFGSYNKRTAFPKPLKAAGKRTFGQMIAKPRFGSMSK